MESDQLQIPRISWIVLVLFAALALAAIGYTVNKRPTHGLEETYVGVRECARCHPRQAESWAATRMARSFDVLRSGASAGEKRLVGLDPRKDYTHDPACLACHTTGYGRVGGFVSIETTPHLAGVTCEACHGPGGRYAKTVMEEDPRFLLATARSEGLIYPPTAQVCTRCHNERSPFASVRLAFDYEKGVREGTHRHLELKYDHGQ